jgi:[acyl-carrier-protein] S-malonyltransferase
MMADLAEASPAARAMFDRADDILGWSVREVCFVGPAERLDRTDVSQPAIFTASAAALAALDEALGDSRPEPAMMAGLSLGEYTALYAADAIDFEPCLRLVAERGRLMQQAAEASDSGMVSVLGLDEEAARKLCEAAAEGDVLTPANFNCPGQVVLSGRSEACRRAAELAGEHGAKAAKPLNVAGAFHSELMAPAAEGLAKALAETDFRPPRRPVLSNVDAKPHEGPERIRERLIAQMTHPVRWEACVRAMIDGGVESFYEIGPGRVLAGLLRRIDRGRSVRSVNSAAALSELAGEPA